MSRIFSLLAICAVISGSLAQYKNDDLYILIDEVSVYSCRGVKNEIKITEEDVNIVNEKGNKVYYVRAPGNYSLHFKNINVQKDFGFLAGEIGVTLQVPIIEGPAGMRFDLPYPMVPETGLLSQKCDENSGIVERNGRQYCRYCDLCAVGQSVESEINRDHVFLPTDETQSTEGKCGSVAADSYEFKKTISLPGKSALERMVKGKMAGLDKEITKRLNKGQGRFQVFLNLIAAAKPSMTQKMFFDNSAECKCCSAREPSAQCSSMSYMYCNIEDCKSSWAHQCLHNTARIAACFTVEFNYRMTTSYSDVLQFLRENNYPNQNIEYPTSRTPPIHRPTAAPARVPVPTFERAVIGGPRRPQPVPQTDESTDSANERRGNQEESNQRAENAEAEEGPVNDRCVARMPSKLTHLRRYCTIFWNAKLCCAHCDGICSPDEE